MHVEFRRVSKRSSLERNLMTNKLLAGRSRLAVWTTLAIVLAAAPILAQMQSKTGDKPKRTCATPEVDLKTQYQIGQQMAAFRDPTLNKALRVDVWVHVINKGAGRANGDMPQSMID